MAARPVSARQGLPRGSARVWRSVTVKVKGGSAKALCPNQAPSCVGLRSPLADGACEGGDPQLAVERFDRTPAQDSRMGLAMPEEFLPYDGEQGQAAAAGADAAELPASAPGRLILRVEGQAEAAAFVATYAEQPEAAAAGEQGQAAAAPAGVEAATQCGACGAAVGGDFAVALHCPAMAAVRRGFPAGSAIVSTSCSRCSAAAAEVRSTGGVAPLGSRLRQALRGAGGRGGGTCAVPCGLDNSAEL